MYEATRESISAHQAPDWFRDAKLGIFIHWGLYSIPGWAPTSGPLPEVVAQQGWDGWFTRNPYAEWYTNSMRIPGSPSAQYHADHYPAGFAYEDFAPRFNAGVAAWDPAAWADLFAAAGARYVVLTTKHHDGFLLWPSAQPNPYRPHYHAARDLVGDLTAAVRARGLTMGLYYSGGLDWTFNAHVIRDIADLFTTIPQQPDYVAYADTHFRELIDRYAPAVLWNDIGYPTAADLYDLFAYYYNQVLEGVINDRFSQVPSDALSDTARELIPGMLPTPMHYDFRTPEYMSYPTIVPEKWESTRGLGFSFGYNRNETASAMLSADELIRSFVDIVSKNGNLLLNIGPMADGTIPSLQRERLVELGQWLGTNGPAIYGSRPWTQAEGRTADGISIRFTQNANSVYAILLDTPRTPQVVIADLALESISAIRLLGQDEDATWRQDDGHLVVTLPARPLVGPAHTLRLTMTGA